MPCSRLVFDRLKDFPPSKIDTVIPLSRKILQPIKSLPDLTRQPAVEKYVLHWGEMGTRWGTNRTVAQIQALLYLSPRPLRADEIVDFLSVARSNVSTSVRELQSYGIVKMTHMLGDRRDYFESLSDVWELFRVIIEQRKQRELNPTLSMLRICAVEVAAETDTDDVTKQRIGNMLKFVETTNNWYEQIQEIPTPTLQKVMKLGARITGFLDK